MASKTVALVGAWDTKAPDYEYLKEQIERLGFEALTFDAGVRGTSPSRADIAPEAVARAAGANLDELVRAGDRGLALAAMARGLATLCREYHDAGQFGGIIAMGGGGGTMLGCAAMRALPLGVPKLMVSTLASSDTSKYIDISDIVMMPSVVDVSGLNKISRSVYRKAAAAICAMVDAVRKDDRRADPHTRSDQRPAIALTMFGNTMRAASAATVRLEAAGFEVVTFHATGAGGRTMEALIAEGNFVGVFDLTTTEIADYVCGGVLSAGPDRLRAAGAKGTPQVVAPGCLDMCNFHSAETVPERYSDRLFYQWDPSVTLMRTNAEENREIARFMASRLNEAIGPVEVHLPLGGYSELDVEGGRFWSPESHHALVETLRSELRDDIPIHLSACTINDAAFAEGAADSLIRLIKAPGAGKEKNSGNREK